MFYLVESRTGPRDGQRFRRELNDDETFETDFIGASPHDCQQWALKRQSQDNQVEKGFIAIADARSASDGTILMQKYNRGEPIHEFGRYGILPPEGDTWYDFRIDHKRADEIWSALSHGAFNCVYPVYFGLKEELTDKNGVFDVARAERLTAGEDPGVHRF